MKTKKELSKGCDKDLGWCSDLLLRNACCGEETELGIEYCPTCQALLQQNKEFIEMIDELKTRNIEDEGLDVQTEEYWVNAEELNKKLKGTEK